jgi:hypothetical protein
MHKSSGTTGDQTPTSTPLIRPPLLGSKIADGLTGNWQNRAACSYLEQNPGTKPLGQQTPGARQAEISIPFGLPAPLLAAREAIHMIPQRPSVIERRSQDLDEGTASILRQFCDSDALGKEHFGAPEA